jgi:hypothetical protein
VQWKANCSHPTARYRGRLNFLEELARSRTPAEFASRIDDNPYDGYLVAVRRPVK